ncbi:unnamed protein product [Ascophyllum nodosum]
MKMLCTPFNPKSGASMHRQTELACLKISCTTGRMVGTGVDSGAFVALDVYNPITPTSKDQPEEYQPSGDPATKAQKRKPRLTGVFESKVPSVLDLPRRKDIYDLSIEKTPLDSAKEKENDTTNTQGTQDRVHTEAVTRLASGNASSTRSTSGLIPGMVKKTAGGRYTRDFLLFLKTRHYIDEGERQESRCLY